MHVPKLSECMEVVSGPEVTRDPYTPMRSSTIPPQQAVLILGQPRQGHEENPLLGPAGFGGDGE